MRPAIKNFIALFIIAVVAMAWYGMTKDGHAATSAPHVDPCPAVATAAQQIIATVPENPHASMWNQTATEIAARRVAALIVQNPTCYSTATVVSATNALAGIGH